MRKRITVQIMAVMVTLSLLMGCSLLRTVERAMQPIPAGVYLNQVRPFVDALAMVYGDRLPEEQRSQVYRLLAQLRDEALQGDDVDVAPVLLVFAIQVLTDTQIDGDELSASDARLALLGLVVAKDALITGEGGEDLLVLTHLFMVAEDVLRGYITE